MSRNGRTDASGTDRAAVPRAGHGGDATTGCNLVHPGLRDADDSGFHSDDDSASYGVNVDGRVSHGVTWLHPDSRGSHSRTVRSLLALASSVRPSTSTTGESRLVV